MWQPTQYYHTKMQLTKMELESKLLPGKYKKPKRKTGSGPIMEKMRMLELTDEPDEEYTNDWNETVDSAEQQVQDEEMILESQSEDQDQNKEFQEEVCAEKKKKKKKKSGKKNLEEQEIEKETVTDIKETDKPEQVSVPDQMDIGVRILSAEQLQNRMIWAEILGEPVSVKRRKKRVEQIYGNQGHAYRR